MELNYKIQTYEWGKRGDESKVAVLHANVNKSFKIEKNVPYSELWLGTHENGPSSLKNGDTLSSLITKHPEYLGDKVLSVNQALSIQAHPSKKHAEELHEQRPDIYKDPNHKPELAIALTPFEALCDIPELNNVVGNILEKYSDTQAESIDLLKEAFRAVLVSPKNVISTQLKHLLQRLKTLDTKQREVQLADLIEKLHFHYPGDVGCFIVYFLNYIKLKPFEAIYLGANEPHAYLYGDCVECMACSDNVVRAGLTPKFIDVDTLCSMLIYKGEKAEDKIFKPIIEDDHSQIFKPPVPDFAVAQIKTTPRSSASILLVISGKAKSDD
ncbi:mannose-6-phosphate isomerase, partial [Asbolus verrucosus]